MKTKAPADEAIDREPTAPSIVQRSAGRLVAAVRRQPALALVLLAYAALLAAVPAFAGPGYDLDQSWQNGVNWAVDLGIRFGPDLDFTYGPWINLDILSLLSLRL